ncbi:MAG: hypothetical protein FJX46_02665, partial [Alphaproteobacteria bacterium]|nr:hypothetical protein [Alphaproteobacteria bacterium]
MRPRSPAVVASPEPLGALLARHGLTPDRRFGQNFLHDRRVVARIAAAAAPFDPMPVIEIGPGP